MISLPARLFALLSLPVLLSACASTLPGALEDVTMAVPGYGEIQEGYITIPPIDPKYLEEPNRRTPVAYSGGEPVGTIIVDPYAKFLYFVDAPGSAIRYPVAVGRQGRSFSGRGVIGRKAEWPGWTPTANMIRREPEVYKPFARGVPGGRASPLGARALYLYRNGRDTLYRIHGTNAPETVGNQGSAGCIRMFNHDIIDLYPRVDNGAQVIVRTYEESVAAEGVEMANRGGEMVPDYVDPDELYAFVEAEEERRAAWEAAN